MSPTRPLPPAGRPSSSLATMEAERQRKAFAWLQADLMAEARHEAKVAATLKELKVWTADEVEPRRSAR